MDTRCCTKCRETKPLTDFYRRGEGHQIECKTCMNKRAAEYRKARPGYGAAAVRRHNLKRKYNLSEEEYDALLEVQEGICPICKETPEERLAVDHDHSTGAVRGLLCPQCNRGLGHFKDDIGRMKAAIVYLEQYQEVS